MFVLLVVLSCGLAPAIASFNCTLPSYPAHGKFKVMGPNRNLLPGTTVDEFTLITYYCDNNYDPSRLSVRAVCNEGKWDSPPPVCRIFGVLCRVALPPSLSNVSDSIAVSIIRADDHTSALMMDTAMLSETLAKEGERCHLVPSLTVDFRCYKSGIEMECPQTGLPYGSVITSTCKSGHSNSEDFEELTCSQGGNWDNPIPHCKPDCGLEEPFGVELIVNGLRGKKNTFPWHVGIFQWDETTNTTEHICGGSIISANLVISAAHCFFDTVNLEQIDARYYKVAAGKFLRSWDNDLPENTKLVQKSDVTRIYLPRGYTGDVHNHQHDLSLLQLATPFKLANSVWAVCYDILNERFDVLQTEPGKIGKVAGWGRTETGNPSEELKTLDLPVIDNEKCRIEMTKYKFSKYLTTDKMCAGHLDGRSLCQGDGGGGLVFPALDTESHTRWYLRGVVSNGPLNDDRTSCRSDTYTAFTHIFKMKDWLKKTIRTATMFTDE